MRKAETQSRGTEKQAVFDDDTVLLNSSKTRARCGGVTPMCLWRWERDPRVQFPHPISINRRNYWLSGDLRRWLEMRQRAAPFCKQEGREVVGAHPDVSAELPAATTAGRLIT